jgi:acetyltransferase
MAKTLNAAVVRAFVEARTAAVLRPLPSQDEVPEGGRVTEEYRIRPIHPEDGEHERKFIDGLSARSLYERTMGGRRTPSPHRIEALVHVNYKDCMAFVATVGSGGTERFIGIARYVREPDRGCEFAIVVADEWQGRGVGTALMNTLIAYARAQSISTLDGVMLATNSRMVALARRMGMTLRLNASDQTTFDASLRL